MLEKKKIVEDSLSEFFRNKLAGISDPFIMDIVTKIRNFTLNGGKRVRPILIQMGHDLYSRDQEGVVMASASIEILQTYLLIHGVIMQLESNPKGVTICKQVANVILRSAQYGTNPEWTFYGIFRSFPEM